MRFVVVACVARLIPVCRSVTTIGVAKEPAALFTIWPDKEIAFERLIGWTTIINVGAPIRRVHFDEFTLVKSVRASVISCTQIERGGELRRCNL